MTQQYNTEGKPQCGEPRNACRSISQAIENASTTDNIWVGPGRYGDLNGDGDFEDQGEEPVSPLAGNW